MQNLVNPVKRILINDWTTKELGYFTKTDPDGLTGDPTLGRTLLFKKANVTIPYVSGMTAVAKTCAVDGIAKSVLVKTVAPAPCEDCHYNYGIDIQSKVKRPGVLNNQYFPKTTPYGGILDVIQTPVSGELDDVDKLTIEDDIITQITADKDAVVSAKRLYVVEIDGLGTSSLTYTVDGHNAATVALGAGTALQAIYALNGDGTFDDHLVAFKKDATHIFVAAKTPGLLFTLEDGNGVTPVVSLERFMWIYAKSADYKFQVVFPMGFMEVTRFNLAILTNGAADASHTVMTVNKTASGDIDGSATSATYAGNINSSSVSAYVMASAITAANNVDVYVYTGIYEARITSLTTDVTIQWQGSGAGTYPNLTSDDVFQLFMNEKHLGGQSNFAYATQPVDGAKYCKLIFTFDVPQGAIHGAGHQTVHSINFEVYIRQGISDTAKWDQHGYMWEDGVDAARDGAAFVADKTFNQILTAWYGAALTVK